MASESSIRDIDSIVKEVVATIPQNLMSAKYVMRLNQVAARANLKGFRPGKVPLDMIEKLYGDGILSEVIEDELKRDIPLQARKFSLNAVGAPEVKFDRPKAHQALTYTVQLSVWPLFEVSGYEDLEVEAPDLKSEASSVDEGLERLRKRFGRAEQISERDVVEEGDVVRYTCTLIMTGKKWAGVPSNPEEFEGQLIRGQGAEWLFNDLLGMKLGEKKTVKRIPTKTGERVKYDDRLYTFELEILEIKQVVPADLNEELFKKCGSDAKSEEEFRSFVKEQIDEKLSEQVDRIIKNSILDELANKNLIQLPQLAIDREIYRMFVSEGLLNSNKVPFYAFNAEMFRKDFGELAAKSVRIGLIIANLAKKFNIVVPPSEIDDWIEKQASAEGVSTDTVRRRISEGGGVESLIAELSGHKLLQQLQSKVKVKVIDAKEWQKKVDERKGKNAKEISGDDTGGSENKEEQVIASA